MLWQNSHVARSALEWTPVLGSWGQVTGKACSMVDFWLQNHDNAEGNDEHNSGDNYDFEHDDIFVWYDDNIEGS